MRGNVIGAVSNESLPAETLPLLLTWKRAAAKLGLAEDHIILEFLSESHDSILLVKATALIEASLNLALEAKAACPAIGAFIAKSNLDRRRDLAHELKFLWDPQRTELR